jgi:hypothetical protein
VSFVAVEQIQRSGNALARKFFQQAIDLDPSLAEAISDFSRPSGHIPDVGFQPTGDPCRNGGVARTARRQAVARDAADAEARMGARITIGDVLSYLASGMTSRKFLRISPTDKGGHPRLSGVCRQA